MIENFTPTASIVIFGAIALAVIILYNFCKMIAKKLK